MKCEEMLAQVLRRWEQGTVHDPDYSGLRLLQRPVRSIMDVGANVGQSIVSLRLTFPDAAITCFEANPMLHASLHEVARRVGGAVVIHPCGLSDASGTFPLHIPYVGDEAFLEEATVRKEYFDAPWVAQRYRERGGLRLVDVDAVLRVGDDFALRPDLIKVDVEGAEASVLRGLLATLTACQPALLVENSDWPTVTALLAPLGYKPYMFDGRGSRLLPLSGETVNTIYLAPRDQGCVAT